MHILVKFPCTYYPYVIYMKILSPTNSEKMSSIKDMFDKQRRHAVSIVPPRSMQQQSTHLTRTLAGNTAVMAQATGTRRVASSAQIVRLGPSNSRRTPVMKTNDGSSNSIIKSNVRNTNDRNGNQFLQLIPLSLDDENFMQPCRTTLNDPIQNRVEYGFHYEIGTIYGHIKLLSVGYNNFHGIYFETSSFIG